jgi:hypothetical protein
MGIYTVVKKTVYTKTKTTYWAMESNALDVLEAGQFTWSLGDETKYGTYPITFVFQNNRVGKYYFNIMWTNLGVCW